LIVIGALAALAGVIRFCFWLKDRYVKGRVEKDYGFAVHCISIVMPGMIGGQYAYGIVIKEKELRDRITTYLGKTNGLTGRFEPFYLSTDHIMKPGHRRTIEDVCAAVEAFRQETPQSAKELNLPEP